MIPRVQTGQLVKPILTASNWNQIADWTNTPIPVIKARKPKMQLQAKGTSSVDAGALIQGTCIVDDTTGLQYVTVDGTGDFLGIAKSTGTTVPVAKPFELVMAKININDASHAFAKLYLGSLQSCDQSQEACFKIISKPETTGETYCYGFLYQPLNIAASLTYGIIDSQTYLENESMTWTIRPNASGTTPLNKVYTDSVDKTITINGDGSTKFTFAPNTGYLIRLYQSNSASRLTISNSTYDGYTDTTGAISATCNLLDTTGNTILASDYEYYKWSATAHSCQYTYMYDYLAGARHFIFKNDTDNPIILDKVRFSCDVNIVCTKSVNSYCSISGDIPMWDSMYVYQLVEDDDD